MAVVGRDKDEIDNNDDGEGGSQSSILFYYREVNFVDQVNVARGRFYLFQRYFSRFEHTVVFMNMGGNREWARQHKKCKLSSC